MEDTQYDVSPEMKRLFAEKQKLRAAAKEYYRKLVHSPYVNDPKSFYDPAVQRFSAMSMYHVELYKPKKQFTRYLTLFVPPLLLFWYIKHVRDEKESILRSGVVSYEERWRSAIY